MKRRFLCVLLFFLSTFVIAQSSGNVHGKISYDSFSYTQHPLGTVWGDPLLDAPALAARGKFMVGVRTLQLFNPNQIDVSTLSTAIRRSSMTDHSPLRCLNLGKFS